MPFSAVVSLLDDNARRRVEACWDTLESQCGLGGIRNTPFPHVSWQVASRHNTEALLPLLARRAAVSAPLTARCSGLGIFSGSQPVLYVQVVKDPALMEFHRLLWEDTWQHAENLSDNYAPDSWIPHITLAYRDISSQNIGCVIQQLAFEHYEWEFRLDNLAVLTKVEGRMGEVLQRYEFKGVA